MGCGGSKGSGANGGSKGSGAFAPPPDSGASPVTDLEITEFTSVISTKIAGLFSKEMKSTSDKEGALFQHIAAQAAKGKWLVASFPKMEMPETPGVGTTLAMAAGQEVSIEMKTTLHTIFQKAPGAVDVMVVYAPISADVSLGFGFNIKMAIEDGLTGTVMTYLQQGWSLAGMSIAGGSSSTTIFEGAKSTSLAEVVFQRVSASYQEGKEVSFVQVGIHVAVSMGKMKGTTPDFAAYLNQQGAEGWEFAGCFTPPFAPPAAGAMSFEYDMPVIIAMQRSPGAKPSRYCQAMYTYKIKAGVKVTIVGDVTEMVKAYAARGWKVKSIFSTVPDGMNMPIVVIFQRQDDVAKAEETAGGASEDEESKNKAAVKIQANFKGKQSRAETEAIATDKKQAATKLQANWRGKEARKSVAAGGDGEVEEVSKQADNQKGDNPEPEVAPFTGPSRSVDANAGGGFFFCCSGGTGVNATVIESPTPR